MTTLADVRRIFSIRGIDPDHLTQAPDSDARFLFMADTGARVWFAPHEHDGQRIGWAYSAWNRDGELTDTGLTDSTAVESVLPVLSRHRTLSTAPASRRQRDALLALANPAEHIPWQLSTTTAAERWILGLFVAWTQLREADAGSICGADLVQHLGLAFEAIGLIDVEVDDDEPLDGAPLDELAARVDPGPDPASADPAAPVIATYLAAALDQARERALTRGRDPQLGVLTVTDLAAGVAAGLRRAGLLATEAGQVGA